MADTDRAKRAVIPIGELQVEGFQMPDGSYRMSITSAAVAVGTTQQNATNFLRSKALQSLQGKGYTPQTPEEIEVESTEQSRGQTRIRALPLDLVMFFWISQCSRGNKQAMTLLAALAVETLERRFDMTFGVARSEAERQVRLELRRLGARIDELESMAAEALASSDHYRLLLESLEQHLQDQGMEPWGVDSDSEED